MPLNSAIQNFDTPPASVEDAQVYLNTLSPFVQEQLIAALYIGREHIHSNKLRSDMEISRHYTDHINKNDGEYARILYEKGQNGINYLNKLQLCAKASSFDLNT